MPRNGAFENEGARSDLSELGLIIVEFIHQSNKTVETMEHDSDATSASQRLSKVFFDNFHFIQQNFVTVSRFELVNQSTRFLKETASYWIEVRSALVTTSVEQLHLTTFFAETEQDGRDKTNAVLEVLWDTYSKLSKLHENTQQIIIQRNINSAMTTSINMLRKKIQPIVNTFHRRSNEFKTVFVNGDSHSLLKSFESIYIFTTNEISAAVEVAAALIREKLSKVKRNSQIQKNLREIKSFINEKLVIVLKIFRSSVSKVKILRKLVKKSKKNVFSKEKNQAQNEYIFDHETYAPINLPTKRKQTKIEFPREHGTYTPINIPTIILESRYYHWKFFRKKRVNLLNLMKKKKKK